MGTNLLACDAFVAGGFRTPADRERDNRAYLAPQLPSLIESTLLYDHVFIPTDDYLNVCVIACLMGPSNLQLLIDSGAIRFCRFRRRQALAPYWPGTEWPGEFVEVELKKEIVHDAGSTQEKAAQASDAIKQVCGVTIPADTLVKSTADVDQIQPSHTIGRLIEKSVREIHSVKTWIKNAPQKADIPPEGERLLTTFSPHPSEWYRTQSQRLLCLYQSQLDLHLQSFLDAKDMRTRLPIHPSLTLVAGRDAIPRSQPDIFSSIKKQRNIPAIGNLCCRSPELFPELVKLRESQAAGEFRDWYATLPTGLDSDTIARHLLDAYAHVPWIKSAPCRVARFVVTQGSGFLPPLGLIASATDSFVVDRFWANNGVRVFLEKASDFSQHRKKA